MISTDKRKLDILQRLVNSSTPVTYEEIAVEFDTSVRTIRNDLSTINEFLQTNQTPKILTDKNHGLTTTITNEQLIRLLSGLTFYEYIPQKREKVIIIIMLLLYSKSYVTLADISDTLVISRSSIISTMSEIDDYLKKYHLMIEPQPGKGLLLIGKEIDKRKLIIDFIIHHLYLTQLFFNHINLNNNHIVIKLALDSSNKIKEIISRAENTTSMYLTENSSIHLYYYLYSMILRNKNGMSIHINKEKDRADIFTNHLYRSIVTTFSLEFSLGEKNLLMYFVDNIQFDQKLKVHANIIKIQALTRKFIDGVANELLIDLENDFELFEGLSNHLETIFNSIDIKTKDDLDVSDIKERYSNVYHALKKHVYIFEDFIQRTLTDIELNYILIYLCVSIEKTNDMVKKIRTLIVCNHGYAGRQILKIRLLKYFDMEIIDIVSSREAKTYNLENIDIIITTVKLNIENKKSIVVSPFINELDCLKIYKAMNSMYRLNQIDNKSSVNEVEREWLIGSIRRITSEYIGLSDQLESIIKDYFDNNKYEMALSEYLQPDFIKLDVECSTWEDAVRAAGSILYDKSYINKHYINAMINNIKTHGPYIILSKGLAVPHASIDSGAKKTGFSLIRLKTPVYFDDTKVHPVYFVCCLACIDKNKHLKSFFNLINMFSNVSFRDLVYNATSPTEVAKIIKKYEKTIKN